jgi:hypothetical protein
VALIVNCWSLHKIAIAKTGKHFDELYTVYLCPRTETAILINRVGGNNFIERFLWKAYFISDVSKLYPVNDWKIFGH